MLVEISVKELTPLDVVPVSVKDVMGRPASVKRINASALRDAAQQRSVAAVVSYTVLSIPVQSITLLFLYNSELFLWTIVCLWR